MLKKIRGFKKKKKVFIKSYTKNRKRIILDLNILEKKIYSISKKLKYYFKLD